MAALLLCSALISGSEVAYFSLSPPDRDSLEKKAGDKQSRVLTLLEKPKKLLATILIANNFVNVAIILLSTYITDALFVTDSSENWILLVQGLVVTFIIMLLVK